MLFDDIGVSLRSKEVIAKDDESITFRYKTFPHTMIWGPLERKPYQSARARYEREKTLSLKLSEKGLRVPEVLECNDDRLEIKVKKLNDSEDFLSWANRRSSPREYKLQFLQDSYLLLKDIHNHDEIHGDPYLKNWLLNRNYSGNIVVHTTGLQYARESENTQSLDVQILTASAISGLRNGASGLSQDDVFQTASDSYGSPPRVRFTPVDRFFFKVRFGIGMEFFDFFEK